MQIGIHAEHLDDENKESCCQHGDESQDGMNEFDDPEEEEDSMTPEDHPVKFNDWDLEIEKDEDYL